MTSSLLPPTLSPLMECYKYTSLYLFMALSLTLSKCSTCISHLASFLVLKVTLETTLTTASNAPTPVKHVLSQPLNAHHVFRHLDCLTYMMKHSNATVSVL